MILWRYVLKINAEGSLPYVSMWLGGSENKLYITEGARACLTLYIKP